MLLLVSRSFKLKMHFFRLYILDSNHSIVYLDDPIKTISDYGIEEESIVFIEETSQLNL